MGTNLSGLLNYFRVYTTPECGEMEAQVKQLLTRKAVEYYRKQGRHFAICLAADEDISVYEALGFVKKKEYTCWTFSQKLVQPWINYIADFFANIEKRLVKGKPQSVGQSV